MQIGSTPELSRLVKHFLIVEDDSLAGVAHRLIPDGNPGIVFHHGVPFLQKLEGDSSCIQQPLSFIYGQVTKTVDLISQGRIGMIVVVLQPYAIQSLTGFPAHRLTNTMASLGEIWGEEGAQLERSVLSATDIAGKMALIETFLRGKCPVTSDTVVEFSIDWMIAHADSGSVQELVAELPVGERQLERAFKTHVGVSPKMFAGMVRMQYFLKSIARPGEENLTSLAYGSGYYDQAHLVNAFKRKSGITPKRYRAVADFLALNFIQFVD
jgi:AraC-like DNA-binding protein